MFKASPFFSLLRHLPSALRRRLLVLGPLLGVSGVLEVISLASLIPLGSVVLKSDSGDEWLGRIGLGGLGHSQVLALFACATVLLFTGKSIFVFLVNRFALHTAAKARAFFQCLLFRAYVNANYSFHLARNSSEYLRNVTTECSSLDARFLTPLVVLAAEIVPVMFILVFLLMVDLWGVIVSSAIFIVSGLAIVKLSAKRMRRLGVEQMACDGAFIKLAQQSFHSPKEICIYQGQDKLMEKAEKYTNDSAATVAKALTIGNFPRFFLEIVSLLVMVLVAAIAIKRGTSMQDLVVELGIFFGAVVKLLPSSSRIVSHFQALNHARPTVENIIGELAAARQAAREAERPPRGDVLQSDQFESIEVEGLSFAYQDGNQLLSCLSFDIRRGEVIGIVGETGSGKTTLVNILLGLIQPSTGSVRINGHALAEIKNRWSGLVGYVPQDIYISDDTLAENVAFFEAREEIDVPRVMAALEAVGLAEFVSAMEEGVFTRLGEHGSRLSGGQKQRIGIARALYRKPEVLFLDEATSALDNQTEAAITESVGSLKGKETIIMIAHRLSSLRYCDRVLRLKDGTIENLTAEQFNAAYRVA